MELADYLDTETRLKELDRLVEKVPEHVVIQKSGIAPGLGVFAAFDLPKGFALGYYRGRIYDFDESEALTTTDAYFMSCVMRNKTMIIDGLPLEHANWTRYINCSRSPKEANVEARDLGGCKVRFYTSKRIKAGDELRFYYGRDYAKTLFN